MAKKAPSFFVTVDNRQIITMFCNKGYRYVTNQGEADFVVFPGGSDVIPILYGEKPLKETSYNLNRDLLESKIFRRIPSTKPKVGICRGAQFLCVMSGGALWQHVNNHTGSVHPVKDIETKKIIPAVTSTHHQMMILPLNALLVAAAKESTRRETELEVYYRREDDKEDPYNDPEVFFSEITNSLGFQPHPEYTHQGSRDYFFTLFDKYITPRL